MKTIDKIITSYIFVCLLAAIVTAVLLYVLNPTFVQAKISKVEFVKELSNRFKYGSPQNQQVDDNPTWQRIFIFSGIVFVICLLAPLVAPTVVAETKVYQSISGAGTKVAQML